MEVYEDYGVCPRSVVDACMTLMRDRANESALRLSTKIEYQLSPLVVDSTRVKQILLNLISNAIKFTEPCGSVVVGVRRTNIGGVEFEVSDTGPGMTPDEIATALEPFGQVDGGIARQHDGTGLGLPLARRLAELHGGSLNIASEKGRGTTVTVTLPASRVVTGDVALTDTVQETAGFTQPARRAFG